MLLALTPKIIAKLAQYHHMTSRQEKDFSHITVRAVESQVQLTPSQNAPPPPLELNRQTSTDHRSLRILVFDIIVVPTDPFGPKDSGLEVALLPLKN